MAEHPNVPRLRRGYEAYGAGDLATLRDMFADDEHAVGLLTGRAERAGKRIEQKVVHVFHLNAEGKVSDW
jgi:ketosteroid isomerase-like protein